jgi:hypothetical protein
VYKNWSHPPGSNWRPADYESAALPTELGWPVFICNSLRAFAERKLDAIEFNWLFSSYQPQVSILADNPAIRQLREHSREPT